MYRMKPEYYTGVDLIDREHTRLFELADEIADLSKKLTGEDPKFEKLLQIIQVKQKEDNNRVIIFSSFRHTLRYLKEKLASRGIRVEQVDGNVADEVRFEMRQRFLLDRERASISEGKAISRA